MGIKRKSGVQIPKEKIIRVSRAMQSQLAHLMQIIHGLLSRGLPNAMKRIQSIENAMLSKSLSHVGGHNVHLVKRLCTVRALSHTVGDAVFNAVVAEKMATRLKDRVLEVLSADGAECKGLRHVSRPPSKYQYSTHSQHLLFARLVA